MAATRTETSAETSSCSLRAERQKDPAFDASTAILGRDARGTTPLAHFHYEQDTEDPSVFSGMAEEMSTKVLEVSWYFPR